MKRRFLAEVISRYDTCVFCTARSAATVTARTASRLAQYRSFTASSRRVQNPVAQQKDEDDAEFSMLAQNAGLSFPARPKPKHDVAPRRAGPSAPQNQNNRTVDHGRQQKFQAPGQRRQMGFPQLQEQSGQAEPVAQKPGRMSRDHDAQRDIPRSTKNGGFIRPRYNFPHARGAAHLGGEQDLPSPQPADTSQNNSGLRMSERNRQQGHRPTRHNRQRDLPRHEHDSSKSSPLSNHDRPLIRRLNLGNSEPSDTTHEEKTTYTPPMVEYKPLHTPDQSRAARTRFSNDDVYNRSSSRNKDTSEYGDILPSEAPPTVALPAAPLLETPDEFHRKRGKSDRRSRRSDRFDESEEGSEEATNTTTSHKASNRAKTFDYDAFEAEDALYAEGSSRKKKKKGTKQTMVSELARPTLQLPEFISVERLARLLKADLDQFINKLEEEGFEGARYDHILDSGTSAMFADLYGFEPLMAGTGPVTDLIPAPIPEDPTSLPPRPPIVTIMGHVDHGKTTILDYLRKSSVVDTEHGGITQHIGAFSVTMPGTNRQITFLDTPGHAAFLEMRRRGANVTDIVVLVVAADDSVKPQTVEAIKHSLEANVQLIVAINKIDKPDADIERVKQDLTRHDIVVEDYGGDYQVIPVSGKTGQGMSELEEAVITLADVNDFRADSAGPVEGWVIESKVTTAGRVATILVRRGTLRPGDAIVAGTTWARVRTLRNDAGVVVSEAPPGTPVQVDGWRGADPTAGLEVLQATDEDHAKDVVDLRLEQEENMKTVAKMAAINTARSEEAEARAKVLEWEREQEWARKTYGRRPKDNEGWVETADSSGPRKVHFIIKADVAGSVEALVAAVSAIGNNEVVANVVHSGTGLLTESDIRMLATTGEKCYAISFNQSIDNGVGRLAEAAGLIVLDHNIIYKVTDNVRAILADYLPPIVTQRVLGEAEVGQVFEITMKRNKVKIAGCRVTNGTISRAHKVRVQRKGEIVFTGNLHSLKNVKKDVTEMRKGTECGMGFEEWEDFQEGDQIQCFEEHQEKRQLF